MVQHVATCKTMVKYMYIGTMRSGNLQGPEEVGPGAGAGPASR